MPQIADVPEAREQNFVTDEQSLGGGLRHIQRERWLAENRAGITAWNEHVAAHGLPLAAYRAF